MYNGRTFWQEKVWWAYPCTSKSVICPLRPISNEGVRKWKLDSHTCFQQHMLKFCFKRQQQWNGSTKLKQKIRKIFSEFKSKESCHFQDCYGRWACTFSKKVASIRYCTFNNIWEKNHTSKMKLMERKKKHCYILQTKGEYSLLSVAPWLCEWDTQLTSAVFDIPKTTIQSWLNNQSFCPRWLPFAKELKPYKVQQIIPTSTGQIWND